MTDYTKLGRCMVPFDLTPPQPIARAPLTEDGSNDFAVCRVQDSVIIQRPVPRHPLTIKQALDLAAWIVALADPSGVEFANVLHQVKER